MIVGPSNIGKTMWARSLGRHIYWHTMIDLAIFDELAEYAVFDDFEWAYMPSKKAWWGGQQQFTITDKYRKKKTIKWGKPIIYLCNPDDDPREQVNKFPQWFRDRSMIIELLNDCLIVRE